MPMTKIFLIRNDPLWARHAASAANRPANRSSPPAVQHKYLQTRFLIVLIGFSELPAPSWRSAVFRSAATLGSFFFDGFSAITMAQYVLWRVCSLRAAATPTMSALDCSRFALWPGEVCHMRNVSAHVLVPAAMFSAATPPVRAADIRTANDPATL